MCHELLSVVWENILAVDWTVLLHHRICLYIWFRLFFATRSCLLEHFSLVGCFVSQALSSWACVCCLLSLVCLSQDRLLFVRAIKAT